MGYKCATTFDPNEVRFMYDGVQLTGWAKDSKYEITPVTENLFEHEVGIDGEVTMSENYDNRHMAKIMLRGNSPHNVSLNTLAKSRLCFDVQVIAKTGGGHILTATRCRVISRPMYKAGKQLADREWKIFIPDPIGVDV